MAAQAGVHNFDGRSWDPSVLERLGDAIAQYGPDCEGKYISDAVGIIYRGFHTTQESRLETQPHLFAGSRVMTWDGRLDNREDLIVQLSLTSHKTDVAIVAAAFERWGTD